MAEHYKTVIGMAADLSVTANTTKLAILSRCWRKLPSDLEFYIQPNFSQRGGQNKDIS